MIERPPGGLPPLERATLRRAAITVALGTVSAVVLAVALASAGVSSGVATAVSASVAGATALFLVFGVFKVQRYAAEMRREARGLPRRERLKRWIPGLILAGLLNLAIWQQGSGLALPLTVFLGLTAVLAIVDVWRAPRD